MVVYVTIMFTENLLINLNFFDYDLNHSGFRFYIYHD